MPVASVVVGFEEYPNDDAPDVDDAARRLVAGILALEPMLELSPGAATPLGLAVAVEKVELEGHVASKSKDDEVDKCLGSLDDIELGVSKGVVISDEPWV
ncbi:hypothetical protein BGZ67_005732 [Mortierella alpina]|nr:hypothetical protein BGZ67_005732 [Mortierella alpina]